MELPRAYFDAEHIPKDRFDQIFCLPPGMPESVDRPLLLVGARGAGKTAYLLYLQRRQPTCSVRLDCFERLASIARRTGRGPYLLSESVEQRVRLRGMANCLLMAALVSESFALDATLEPALEVVFDLLPRELRPQGSSLLQRLSDLRSRAQDPLLLSRPLEEAAACSVFRCSAQHIGQVFARSGACLNILLDRADFVSESCAYPALELLDQSASYVAIVATRPCPDGAADWGTEIETKPDDHYDVLGLGNPPNRMDWIEFASDALRRQLYAFPTLAGIAPEFLNVVSYYAKDSLRLGLHILRSANIYSKAVDGGVGSGDIEASLKDAFKDQKRRLVERAAGLLEGLYPSFVKAVAGWPSLVMSQLHIQTIDAPIVVHIRGKASEATSQFSRLLSPSPGHKFVAACIRESIMHPHPGEVWCPGRRFEKVEFAPLILWSPK